MSRPVTMMDVRGALHDRRFLDMFPELASLADRYTKSPQCGSCGVALAREIIQRFPERLGDYFVGRDLPVHQDGTEDRQFEVINCHVDDLEAKLRGLPPGVSKHVALARWEDQVTVVIQFSD